jgi:hypothetical protein
LQTDMSFWSYTKKVIKKYVIDEIDKNDRREQQPVASSFIPGNHRLLLPFLLPIPEKNQPPWNVIRSRKKVIARISAEGDSTRTSSQPSLRIDYAPGKVGSCSGFGLFAAPQHAFPSTSATFSYKVYIDNDFDWVRGGKLPGLFIGSPGASGGNWEANAGSVRVVWQRKGIACLYVYIPLQVSTSGTKEGALHAQSAEFRDCCHMTKKGCHLWHTGPLTFTKGAWNDVSISLTLNHIGSHDGSVQLTVNDRSVSCSGLTWRSQPHLQICGVSIQTFYGGSSPEAAVPSCGSHLKFREFSV